MGTTLMSSSSSGILAVVSGSTSLFAPPAIATRLASCSVSHLGTVLFWSNLARKEPSPFGYLDLKFAKSFVRSEKMRTFAKGELI